MPAIATIYLNKSEREHPNGILWEAADWMSGKMLSHCSGGMVAVTETFLVEDVIPLARAHQWDVRWGDNHAEC